jgi:hypothetical protein
MAKPHRKYGVYENIIISIERLIIFSTTDRYIRLSDSEALEIEDFDYWGRRDRGGYYAAYVGQILQTFIISVEERSDLLGNSAGVLHTLHCLVMTLSSSSICGKVNRFSRTTVADC